ncbi:transmembrane protein, putative [Medicago truncatula]|uniref:Transmembrane protein, putative n=1 Tax=Medicago truncatula TaxID=3880 RepID=A0A072VGI6_MEDTR|nr:transmembrane protein, putative [Medicago truncatula]
MEVQQWWKLRFSFKNATILVCFLNIITAIFLLHGFFFSSPYTRTKLSTQNTNSAELNYIKESEEIRLAMLPLELIKRLWRNGVKEKWRGPDKDNWRKMEQPPLNLDFIYFLI